MATATKAKKSTRAKKTVDDIQEPVDNTEELDQVTEEELENIQEEVDSNIEETIEEHEDAEEQETEETSEELVDKYEANRNVNKDEAYDIVKTALFDQDLSIDERLQLISNNASIDYKSIIEAFAEFDRICGIAMVSENPIEFSKKVANLYSVIKSALEEEDLYVSFLKLKLIELLYAKYRDTSLVVSVYCAYSDEYPGGEEEYQDFQYIMATLSILNEVSQTGKYDQIPKLVNFKRKDFLHGARFEEYYTNTYQG